MKTIKKQVFEIEICERVNEHADEVEYVVVINGDEDMYRGVDIVVEKEDGLADEWWEAELTRKEIK